MKKPLQLLLGVISHLLVTSFTLAQSDLGTIYGSVVCESKESIPLSTVVLIKDSEIEAGIITDQNGNFILGNIEPGVYDLKISSVGFSSKYIRGIRIENAEIHLPLVELNWGLRISSVVCSAYRPFCNKLCGFGCICECCVPSAEYNDGDLESYELTTPVDTTNFLAQESWHSFK